MISLTRLNGEEIVVNAELIKLIERTPDTLLTLTSNDKLMVKEDLEDVLKLYMAYKRAIQIAPQVLDS